MEHEEQITVSSYRELLATLVALARESWRRPDGSISAAREHDGVVVTITQGEDCRVVRLTSRSYGRTYSYVKSPHSDGFIDGDAIGLSTLVHAVEAGVGAVEPEAATPNEMDADRDAIRRKQSQLDEYARVARQREEEEQKEEQRRLEDVPKETVMKEEEDAEWQRLQEEQERDDEEAERRYREEWGNL